jgi:hypothetical protein
VPVRSPAADRSSRNDALRRFAAEVSGRQDLDGLFRDVIDESFTLFGVDEAGLWMYDGSPTPLTLAAQRGLSREVLEIIATLPRDAPTAGMRAMRAQEVRIMRGDLGQTLPAVQEIYWNAGIRTICYVPVVFQHEPLGLRVDRRGDRARPRLRRPHGYRDQQRAPGVLDAHAGRPTPRHLRARGPSQQPA